MYLEKKTRTARLKRRVVQFCTKQLSTVIKTTATAANRPIARPKIAKPQKKMHTRDEALARIAVIKARIQAKKADRRESMHPTAPAAAVATEPEPVVVEAAAEPEPVVVEAAAEPEPAVSEVIDAAAVSETTDAATEPAVTEVIDAAAVSETTDADAEPVVSDAAAVSEIIDAEPVADAAF